MMRCDHRHGSGARRAVSLVERNLRRPATIGEEWNEAWTHHECRQRGRPDSSCDDLCRTGGVDRRRTRSARLPRSGRIRNRSAVRQRCRHRNGCGGAVHRRLRTRNHQRLDRRVGVRQPPGEDVVFDRHARRVRWIPIRLLRWFRGSLHPRSARSRPSLCPLLRQARCRLHQRAPLALAGRAQPKLGHPCGRDEVSAETPSQSEPNPVCM